MQAKLERQSANDDDCQNKNKVLLESRELFDNNDENLANQARNEHRRRRRCGD